MLEKASMKASLRLAFVTLIMGASILFSQSGEAPVDFNKARQLFEKRNSGTSLTPEESAYIERAQAARQRGKTPANQRKAPESLKPLCDMTADDRYEGEDGGLYGKGSNEPSDALKKSAAAALALIKPLDAGGKPADSGNIVFVSISMSNATMEFSTFKRIADTDERKSGKLTIVDCAQGGQAMAQWVPEDGRPWQEAMKRIEQAGVTPQQVQVAWIKLANMGPSGSMVEHLTKLEADTTAVIKNAKKRFPNLRIAYLGSRIWAGNATGGLNPEPYAYEGAFAVRHLIQKQNHDEAPLLLWGPYLWAEGEKGRKQDDVKYLKDDFAGDGTHPSRSGQEKVASQLLDFFTTNPLAKSWFAK